MFEAETMEEEQFLRCDPPPKAANSRFSYINRGISSRTREVNIHLILPLSDHREYHIWFQTR